MKTFSTKEDFACMNKELEDLYLRLSNLSDNCMYDVVELAFPGEVALPDKEVCSILESSLSHFTRLSALFSTLSDQFDILLGK